MNVKAIVYFSMLAFALVAYIAILSSIPLRRKKILKSAGKCLMSLPELTSKKWLGIAIMAGILIVIVPLRNFGIFISGVLLGAGLLAAELAARQALGSGKAGIYENMLISETSAVLWSDILSLPTLAYENDPETSQVDRSSLRILTQKGEEKLILFSSEEERQKAVELILKLAPSLKP